MWLRLLRRHLRMERLGGILQLTASTCWWSRRRFRAARAHASSTERLRALPVLHTVAHKNVLRSWDACARRSCGIQSPATDVDDSHVYMCVCDDSACIHVCVCVHIYTSRRWFSSPPSFPLPPTLLPPPLLLFLALSLLPPTLLLFLAPLSRSSCSDNDTGGFQGGCMRECMLHAPVSDYPSSLGCSA